MFYLLQLHIICIAVPDAPLVSSVPRYLNGGTGRTRILIGLNTTFDVEVIYASLYQYQAVLFKGDVVIIVTAGSIHDYR